MLDTWTQLLSILSFSLSSIIGFEGILQRQLNGDI